MSKRRGPSRCTHKPSKPEPFEHFRDGVFDRSMRQPTVHRSGAPKFRMVAYTGGPMRVAGLARYPVIIDLAGLAIPSQARVPIRFGHDPLSGVGHTMRSELKVANSSRPGSFRATHRQPGSRGDSKNGFPWQASVGAGVDEFEFVKDGQKVTVNGTQYSGPVNVVRKSSLGEISFVDLGADGAHERECRSSASATPGEPDMDDSQTPTQDDPKRNSCFTGCSQSGNTGTCNHAAGGQCRDRSNAQCSCDRTGSHRWNSSHLQRALQAWKPKRFVRVGTWRRQSLKRSADTSCSCCCSCYQQYDSVHRFLRRLVSWQPISRTSKKLPTSNRSN